MLTSGKLKSILSHKIALVLMSVAFALVLTVVMDRCIGLFVDIPVSLIFPRHSIAKYSTPEFHIQARINNLGFRGEDVPIRKRRKFRVMALGDSFTFGWGLELPDSWPKVLEGELQKRGLDVEVLNLGRPGAAPVDYADIADKAVPLLKPDLILVAVDHGDDLAQTIRENMKAPQRKSGRSFWRMAKLVVKATYPNLVALSRASIASRQSEVQPTDDWKPQVADLLAKLTPSQKAKYDQLDDEVKGRFVRGELNARILADSLENPDEMQGTLEMTNAVVQEGIRQMGREFSRIKVKATASHGRVAVLSLPNGFFVSRELQQTYKRLGFVVEPWDLTTTAMDDAIRLSASSVGVPYFDVTAAFRKESTQRLLFFVFDGHYNAAGARFFAQNIADFVSAQLEQAAR